MEYYANISDIDLLVGGTGNPFTYQFNFSAYDQDGLVVWEAVDFNLSTGSGTWKNSTVQLYEAMKDAVISDVFVNVAIDVPSDHVYLIGQPDTFTFPDIVQVQSDSSTLAVGFGLFVAVMFFVTWFFRYSKKT